MRQSSAFWVSRFVPVRPLDPGQYWWRVRRGAGVWSEAVAFEVRMPERRFTIRAGSDARTVGRTISEAAAQTPASVLFEPGNYNLSPEDGKSLVALAEVSDLRLDGPGARLVLGGTFLRLTDCRRVAIRNFTVTGSRPGHTLVRVLEKDSASRRLVVQPERGYDPDVPHYFDMKGTGGSFLGCMDTVHRGKYVIAAGVSARNVTAAPAPGRPGVFVLSPVDAATLERCPLNAPAVVTAYRWQWLQFVRGEENTLSRVTVVDLPGAFTGGGSSAKSYLSCKVQRRTPQDYYGGHSATGSGRIGEWIEDCDFEYLPDDGPAEQSFRQSILRADGPDAVVLAWNAASSPVQPGDRIALARLRQHCGAIATVRAVTAATNGIRVQLDCSLAELAPALGGGDLGPGSDVYLYIDAPSNEDFVYRRNRHLGGRGHGVKFNGSRGWIADSVFENINGNAIMAGYTSEVSGHGASDVVISGNTITRCGWTPISSISESRLARNLVIRDNRIREVRETAIHVIGYRDALITGNEFSSSTPPKRGAWVVSEAAGSIRCERNRFAGDLPEYRAAVPRP